jgi:hypothetical protein
MIELVPQIELKCDKCHKKTPVRVNGLCRKCRGFDDENTNINEKDI